jgi:hypothetical protein
MSGVVDLHHSTGIRMTRCLAGYGFLISACPSTGAAVRSDRLTAEPQEDGKHL